MSNTVPAPAPIPDRFWEIVEATLPYDREAQADRLREALTALGSDDVKAFDAEYHRQTNAAYAWDLWGAAYVINGGCSDDGFMDFRAWLIAQGRAVFEAALADPETLADVALQDEAEFEDFAYVAREVLEARGEEMPFFDIPHPTDPSGEEWDEDDLEEKFPKLWDTFGED